MSALTPNNRNIKTAMAELLDPYTQKSISHGGGEAAGQASVKSSPLLSEQRKVFKSSFLTNVFFLSKKEPTLRSRDSVDAGVAVSCTVSVLFS